MQEDREELVEHSSPWWLDGQHLCQFCCHQYVLEMEYRCVQCDLPICPLCVRVVRETAEHFCPHCQTE